MAKQVYVYFRPVLVDVPDNVYEALSADGRDKVNAEIVCAQIAAEKIAEVNPALASTMAGVMMEQVVKA